MQSQDAHHLLTSVARGAQDRDLDLLIGRLGWGRNLSLSGGRQGGHRIGGRGRCGACTQLGLGGSHHIPLTGAAAAALIEREGDALGRVAAALGAERREIGLLIALCMAHPNAP